MTTRAEQMVQFLDSYLMGYTQHPLAGDASFRRYIRVYGRRRENEQLTEQGEARSGGDLGVKTPIQDKTFMLMDAPPAKENIRPFIAVCRHLRDAGFSAPNMIAGDVEQGFLLLEDLEDDTFSRLLRADITHERIYYTAAVELLAAWHTGKLPAAGLMLPSYDTTLLTTEIQLFSNWFLPQFLGDKRLAEAQASYAELWQQLLRNAPLATDQFVHRDYHADNLMWLSGRAGAQRVGLLDFQDAVAGDAAYDLVSLLEDARRDVPADLAQAMVVHYLTLTGANRQRFAHAYALLAAQRNSKIIGIFTRLAARDGKAHYLDYLPRVWAHLMRDAEHPLLSPLKDWLNQYVPHDKRGIIAIAKNAAALGLAA